MVALSFVRSAEDIEIVHEVMDDEGRRVPVIAKLEKPQAVENLDEIIDAFDAFMVARGDLGVELPLEEVPLVQKKIVTAARRWAKPVIVATQMLESMISSPRPTRAEASDVANAILDGADAVMLSGETSVGEYPVVAVETMARIVENTEAHGMDQMHDIAWDPHTTSGVITKAAAEVGRSGSTPSSWSPSPRSGDSARRLSRLRSPIPILAFTPIEQTRAALTLNWGVETLLVPMVGHTDDMIRQVDKALADSGHDRRRRSRGDRRRLPARRRRPHQHDPGPPDRRAALTLACGSRMRARDTDARRSRQAADFGRRALSLSKGRVLRRGRPCRFCTYRVKPSLTAANLMR